MNCFIDYIGLRYCSASQPESGFYINDMAGMSIKRMDNIASQEKKTFVEVWDAIQRRCAMEMEARILNKFTNYYKINKTLYDNTFGYFDHDYPFLDLEPVFKGVYLYTYNRTYVKVDIEQLELYSSQAYTGAKFYVYDLNSGTKLKEVTVDLVDGYNLVSINFSSLNKANYFTRYFVCYDASIISLKKSLNTFIGYDFAANNVTSVQDAKLTGSFTYNNIQSGDGSGLSVRYSAECSLEAFICERKQLFKYAWSKLLAAEIYNETLQSDRTNWFTTIDAERALVEYNRNMSDFSMSVTDVLENMDVPNDEICFECNTQTYSTYGRP